MPSACQHVTEKRLKALLQSPSIAASVPQRVLAMAPPRSWVFHRAAAPDDLDQQQGLTEEDIDTAWHRYSIFALLILPVVFAILVVLALLVGWTIDGKARNALSSNRATTQIVVQIISGILGTCDVALLKKLVNFASRQAIRESPMTLDRVSFLAALSTGQLNSSLRWMHLSLLLVFLGLAVLPAALWAGALTPIDITVSRAGFSVKTPAYSNETSHTGTKPG